MKNKRVDEQNRSHNHTCHRQQCNRWKPDCIPYRGFATFWEKIPISIMRRPLWKQQPARKTCHWSTMWAKIKAESNQWLGAGPNVLHKFRDNDNGIFLVQHLLLPPDPLTPLINLAAVKSNLSFIAVVLLALALSNARILWKCTLLDLVRLEKKREKPIHPHASAADTRLKAQLLQKQQSSQRKAESIESMTWRFHLLHCWRWQVWLWERFCSSTLFCLSSVKGSGGKSKCCTRKIPLSLSLNLWTPIERQQ